MNKLRQGLIVSTIATLSLFSQINEAIASVLNKDKTNYNTEELVKITDNTASAISINFDNNANITPPDSTQIKAFFMEWDILTNDEKKDFIELRDKISKNDARTFYERQMQRALNWTYTNEEAKMFIGALMDQEQETARWKTEHEKVNQKKIYQYILSQMLRQITSEINLAQSIEEWERIKEEWIKIKEEWIKLDEDITKLDEDITKLDEDITKLDEDITKLDKNIEKLKEDKKKADEYKKKVEEDKKKADEDKKTVDEMIKSLDEMKKTFEEYQKKE